MFVKHFSVFVFGFFFGGGGASIYHTICLVGTAERPAVLVPYLLLLSIS